MRMVGLPVSQIKERGQWASNCVYKYIKPTVGEKLRWDNVFSLR